MLESKMKKTFHKLLSTVFFQDIESTTGLGIPDTFYSIDNVAGWIEAKKIDRRIVSKVTIPWRPGQYAWYLKYRRKSSCPYFVLLTIKDAWYLIHTKIERTYLIGDLNENYYIGHTENLKTYQQRIIETLTQTE